MLILASMLSNTWRSAKFWRFTKLRNILLRSVKFCNIAPYPVTMVQTNWTMVTFWNDMRITRQSSKRWRILLYPRSCKQSALIQPKKNLGKIQKSGPSQGPRWWYCRDPWQISTGVCVVVAAHAACSAGCTGQASEDVGLGGGGEPTDRREEGGPRRQARLAVAALTLSGLC